MSLLLQYFPGLSGPAYGRMAIPAWFKTSRIYPGLNKHSIGQKILALFKYLLEIGFNWTGETADGNFSKQIQYVSRKGMLSKFILLWANFREIFTFKNLLSLQIHFKFKQSDGFSQLSLYE